VMISQNQFVFTCISGSYIQGGITDQPIRTPFGAYTQTGGFIPNLYGSGVQGGITDQPIRTPFGAYTQAGGFIPNLFGFGMAV